jgi:hypothetical protein
VGGFCDFDFQKLLMWRFLSLSPHHITPLATVKGGEIGDELKKKNFEQSA